MDWENINLLYKIKDQIISYPLQNKCREIWTSYDI